MNTKHSSAFLMANLGSEVTRLLSALEKGDKELSESARIRSEKIIGEIELSLETEPSKKEVRLLSDVINDFCRPKRRYSVSYIALKQYFLPFALRVFN
ncbi:MAG: hypothetical protein A3D52_02605 [Candidatus Taylorbacteria bacterium RIFCSPHIGHO2_02_FULL_44_36]|uniref:Uncharacterized protein n=1 Tax=Candidatus Taylorbacteria bacterium RIFCSPLOWO2_12_FULL_44_15c TaxID=1802333 RepID=A0A1G2P4X6_9BACT|nr:MAG: hypothetical protein A3D52_02605 [Candidatus Taylorbacteria bacterium RIFCSPHIGHO2_02_FULL_44_36]OHA38033.1 MAG: hypothetical protein A3I97_02990 [Candidatus Taylorbacteria bacterium RIFCSPLOWO2_02_FULL_44_35]OHA43417.1 MAG: hypothetical protein A3G03_01210 [Candidatus Taylorbacteria bacterium RIFCSPLOWO2_12_FULL_44_15c]